MPSTKRSTGKKPGRPRKNPLSGVLGAGPSRMIVQGAFVGGLHIPIDPPITVFPGDVITIELADGSTITLQ